MNNSVVLDFLLSGIGISTFLFGVLLYCLDSYKYKTIIKKSFIISFILIISPILISFIEVERSLIILNVPFSVNPTSLMSTGIYLQGICLLLMLIVLLKIKNFLEISKSLICLTGVFAGLVGLYHGFLLTGMEKTVWNSIVPVIFFLSSIVSVSSLALLMSSSEVFEKTLNTLKLPLIFNMILTLQFITICSWIYSLSLEKDIYSFFIASYGTELLVLIFFVGIVTPLLLISLSLIKKIEFKKVLV